MKNKLFKLFFAVVILLQSCSNWLAVAPSDRITKEATFSTVPGFQTALNGVYIELNSPALYGKNLSYDFVELLANRYAINSENQDRYKLVNDQNYTTNYAKGILTEIWKKGYNLIANLNLIIENTVENRHVLNDRDYAIVRGEALALRAMLHFDLLRLYGPVPANNTKTAIPYYKTFEFLKKEYLSVDSVINCTVTDLLEAADLLKPYDPIVKYGVVNDNEELFLNFRNIRLNYYAVKALLARVYLYRGDKPNALEAAKEVIAVQESYFPFTPDTKLLNSLDNPDRVYSSEILFGLQNLNRTSIFTSTFNAMTLTAVNAYYSKVSIVESADCFESTSKSDSRFKCWFNDSKEIGGELYYIFQKYKGGADNLLLYNQLIPMIKVSEVYYIAAESEPEIEDGLKYLNKVRNNRGLQNVSTAYESTFEGYRRKEYLRETWGDGQLFFYYKRLNKANFVSAYFDKVYMTANKYVMPLPDDEKNYN